MAGSLIEKMERKRQELLGAHKNETETARKASAVEPPPRTTTAAEVMRNQMNAASIDTSVRFVDLDLIDVEEQVRDDFDEEYIKDLACDFAISPTLQPNKPITLFERGNGRFLLDTGENRFRAMRYAREHRLELQIQDVTAFTTIRATIKGPEPSLLERTQSQVKENVLSKNLNMLELGKALLRYFNDNPSASQSEAADWCGFRNSGSGRVKVNTALKLMKCDEDLKARVSTRDLSVQRALEIQEARIHEKQQAPILVAAGDVSPPTATTDTGAAAAKPSPGKGAGSKPTRSQVLETAPKKQVTVAVSLEKTLQIGEVLNWIGQQKGLGTIDIGTTPGRKDAMAILNSELLDAITNFIKNAD